METFLIRMTPPEVEGQDYSLTLVHGEDDGNSWPDQSIGPETVPAADVRALLTKTLQLDDDTRAFDADEAMGDELFALLDRGAVGQKLRETLGVNPAMATSCRFVLELPRALEGLPWELLRHGQRQYLFMDSTRVWMRGNISPKDERAVRTWPLKVMVVIGCAPGGLIAYEEELEAIRAALGSMGHAAEYVVVEQPTRDELLKSYQAFRPHLFHFIGHGERASEGKKAELLFDLPRGNGWSWREDRIQMDLSSKAPLVAVINACGSANGGGGWSVASAFLAAGSGAAVGMQANIRGTSAARFAKEFYGAIANAGDGAILLPEIVAEARQMVDTLDDRSAWALPVFSLRVRPERALPISLEPAERYARSAMQIPEFTRKEPFVNRREERRLLRLCLDGVDPEARPKTKAAESEQYLEMQQSHKITAVSPPLLVLRGPEKIGKTRLAHWLLEHGERRGLRTVYVNWQEASKRDVVGVLRFIRDGEKDTDSPLRKGFSHDREAFSKFNRDLNLILRGQRPPDDDPPAFVADEREDYDDRRARLEDGIDRLFESFRDALVRVMQKQPTVLVLDQFDRLDDSPAREYLRKRLLREVAQNKVAGLRLILVVRHAEYTKWDLAGLVHRCVDVDLWPSARFRELMAEYGKLEFKSEQAKEKIQGILDEWSEAFEPEDLRKSFQFFERFAKKTPGSRVQP